MAFKDQEPPVQKPIITKSKGKNKEGVVVIIKPGKNGEPGEIVGIKPVVEKK